MQLWTLGHQSLFWGVRYRGMIFCSIFDTESMQCAVKCAAMQVWGLQLIRAHSGDALHCSALQVWTGAHQLTFWGAKYQTDLSQLSDGCEAHTSTSFPRLPNRWYVTHPPLSDHLSLSLFLKFFTRLKLYLYLSLLISKPHKFERYGCCSAKKQMSLSLSKFEVKERMTVAKKQK